jgi:hypothetical protein
LTLWKIKDCEELMKSRISEEKVVKMVEALDKKFDAELKLIDAQQNNNLNKMIN